MLHLAPRPQVILYKGICVRFDWKKKKIIIVYLQIENCVICLAGSDCTFISFLLRLLLAYLSTTMRKSSTAQTRSYRTWFWSCVAFWFVLKRIAFTEKTKPPGSRNYEKKSSYFPDLFETFVAVFRVTAKPDWMQIQVHEFVSMKHPMVIQLLLQNERHIQHFRLRFTPEQSERFDIVNINIILTS